MASPGISPPLSLHDEVARLRVRNVELERELRESREVLERMPVMVSILRAPDFVYAYVNPAFGKLAPGKEFLGRRFEDVWAEVSCPLVEILRNVIRTEEPFQRVDAPYTIQRGPGEQPEAVYVSYSWIPLAGPDGKPDRILTLASETTEAVLRRQVEGALFGSRAKLAGALASMTDAVFISDAAGRFVECNEAFATYHKFASMEETPKRLAEYPELLEVCFADGSVAPLDMWAVPRALRGETATNAEYRLRRKDTGEKWIGSYSFAPIRDRDGAIVGSVVVGRDVTASKQAKAETVERLSVLAGGIAHDFNNLLVGVIGNAGLALQHLTPEHAAHKLVERVIHAGDQAAQLTRRMLAYSGKGRFEVERLNLSQLIPGLAEKVEATLSGKIVLRLELDWDLPPVEADRGEIGQVFLDLVRNAEEAIGEAAGTITVSTGVRQVDADFQRVHAEAAGLPHGSYVWLEVRDTGCGMDAATKARIFDPFFSTKFTGRGLGLAAVSGVVRGHKGSILVETAVGKGSSFTLLFPVAPGAVADGAPSRAGASAVVLVVDDEELVRELAKNVLEMRGYTVLLAESGQAALEVYRRHGEEIGLVILDLSMPNLNGRETLVELRKVRRDVKVILSSGYSEGEAMRGFAGMAVSGFLQKPYHVGKIVEKVRLALG